MKIGPGARYGAVKAPESKSHAHRVVIASFLAGRRDVLSEKSSDSLDVRATKRCLAALSGTEEDPVLDCGESGSTLRFLAPVAAALGKRPHFLKAGRLADRPALEYTQLKAGVHVLPGDVSSQFATGLLFALPLLEGNSRIVFSSPLESRGYVDMTLDVIRSCGIEIKETQDGFDVPGGQRYSAVEIPVIEGDWSGAAFWLAMNSLGSCIEVSGLGTGGFQPDSAAQRLFSEMPDVVDVSQCPDLFPALAVAAAGGRHVTRFTGISRLRIKECDRAAAMEDVLAGFGVRVACTGNEFTVFPCEGLFKGGVFRTYGDHRIAMAIAAGATHADSCVEMDDSRCVAKSYPGFFADFCRLGFKDDKGGLSLAALSLGSNVSPRREYLARAVEALSSLPSTKLVAESSVVETEGVDVPAQFSHLRFLNEAVLLRTGLEVEEFSRLMHLIEDRLGRKRTIRNAPRTIDIDLVDFDSLHMDTDTLTLPHPRASMRDFVRIPLEEIGFHLQ